MAWVERSGGLDQPLTKWWLSTGMLESRCIAAYQPVGSADIAQSYQNLAIQGGFDASPVVAPTFATATGWTFSGTEHLATGITGDGLQTVIARVNIGVPASRMSIVGYDTGSRQFYIEVDFFGGVSNIHYLGYNATEGSSVNPTGDVVLALARNRLFYQGIFQTSAGSLATWNEGTITIANNIVTGSAKFTGDILALAVYSDKLTDSEVFEISTAMAALTSSANPIPPSPVPVNWIVQNPATKHLNSASHELWAATDSGIFHTENGGRHWAEITLPDPSNAEFSDSPAATIDELTFHWIDYDPTNELTLLALAAKDSSSRIWVYKSVDLGLNWSSRGVTTT